MRRLLTFLLVAGFTALATLSWLNDTDPDAVRTATSMAAQAPPGAGLSRSEGRSGADWEAPAEEEAGLPEGEP